jgi:hypothetical protein
MLRHAPLPSLLRPGLHESRPDPEQSSRRRSAGLDPTSARDLNDGAARSVEQRRQRNCRGAALPNLDRRTPNVPPRNRGSLPTKISCFSRRLLAIVWDDDVCRRLVPAPPWICRNSEAVGAVFGLTPSRYQSGESETCVMSYEAAQSMLVRSAKWSWLKAWAMIQASRDEQEDRGTASGLTAPNSDGSGKSPQRENRTGSNQIGEKPATHLTVE